MGEIREVETAGQSTTDERPDASAYPPPTTETVQLLDEPIAAAGLEVELSNASVIFLVVLLAALAVVAIMRGPDRSRRRGAK